ncbi:MAG: peptidoglycan D,D-transpeptidase FtsI family protein [Candidatus Nucleicultricaceae bacterium]
MSDRQESEYKERARYKSSLAAALDTAKTRLLISGALYLFCVVMVLFRLCDLMLFREGSEPTFAENDIAKGIQTGRADVLDRNGVILATTIKTTSVYANAKQVLNVNETCKKLATVMQGDLKGLQAKLESGKTFVWVARHLTPEQKEKILRLGLPGINFVPDYKRIYPHGALASHVLGFTNIDNQGISGIEKSLNKELSSSTSPVQTSIDVRLQHIVRDEIKRGIEEFSAIGGAGLILDIQSGEIVSLVSAPDFNPNHPTKAPRDNLFNKVSMGSYEMGSTMKIATIAMALEYEIAKLSTIFDVTKPLRVGRFKITDNHPKGRPLNVAEIFIHSSNIGTAQLALLAGAERQQQFLRKLGFMDALDIELPEVGMPMIPKVWKEPSVITVSYGYGMSITPVQLAAGVATLAAGGLRVHPTLIKGKNRGKERERIISEDHSKKILQLMRFVITDGTARKTNIKEYFVAGKTGTRKLLIGRKYNDNNVATSFMGVFGQINNQPRYAIFVMLEDPKATKKTFGFNAAGWNSVVVTRRIIERAAPLLGLIPNKMNVEEAIDEYFQQAHFRSSHDKH